MEKSESAAEVYTCDKFIKIATYSTGMLAYPEPSAPVKYLLPSVGDIELGAELRSSLRGSFRVSVPEFQKIFASGVIQRLAEERAQEAMKRFDFKSKREMYRKMDNCSVTVFADRIEIQPMHHKSLDGYSAVTSGPALTTLSLSASDAELGAALREAFKRCTSSVK
jgi:hypothetical protein